jgi:hypothetical protein
MLFHGLLTLEQESILTAILAEPYLDVASLVPTSAEGRARDSSDTATPQGLADRPSEGEALASVSLIVPSIGRSWVLHACEKRTQRPHDAIWSSQRRDCDS